MNAMDADTLNLTDMDMATDDMGPYDKEILYRRTRLRPRRAHARGGFLIMGMRWTR